jgi:hypothetical protein
MSTPHSTDGCELAHLDGVYVLGALPPEERLEFERHLRGCPVCARAVQQLAGLPGLLSQVSAEVLQSAPADEPVPGTLLPALVREVRRGRRRRRWVTGLAAAAAVAVVGAVSVGVVTMNDGDGAPTAVPTASPSAREMTPVGAHGVTGWLALTSVAWGTRLDLTCSYEPPPEGYYHHAGPPTYELVVHTRGGATEEVASWHGVPGRTMTITGATAASVDDIVSVEVRSAGGRPVLRIRG